MRKLTADYLFNGKEMAPEGAVLVIRDDGTVEGVLSAAEAGTEGVERMRGMLTPGFVNCHCHLELSHMKGVMPEGMGMVDFLLGVIRGRQPAGAGSGGRSAGGSGLPGGGSGGAGVGLGGAGVGSGGGHLGSGSAGAASDSAYAGSGDAAMPDVADPVLAAIARAEGYMLDHGIVAVGDICNTSLTLHQKREGRLHYHNFIETMGFVQGAAAARFDASLKLFQELASIYPLPMAANSVVPHAPYSVSPRLFRLIADFPGNTLVTIHNQESREENLFLKEGTGDFLRLYQGLGLDVSFFSGTGKRSMEAYLPYFRRNQTLLLVHNVDTTEEDLQWWGRWRGDGAGQGGWRGADAAAGGWPGADARPAGERGAGAGSEGAGSKDTGSEGAKVADAGSDLAGPEIVFCLCPNANLYIGGKLPDVELLMRYGCRIVLGTDSLASNHQLDILEEMKTLQRHFTFLDTSTLLQWATFNGARALEMNALLGEFAPGKKPGVVLIDGIDNGRFTDGSRAQRVI